MQQIKKHHALTDEDDMYLQLMDACLKNYMNFESKRHLLDAFATARILFFIYGALANHRLMIACDKDEIYIIISKAWKTQYSIERIYDPMYCD